MRVRQMALITTMPTRSTVGARPAVLGGALWETDSTVTLPIRWRHG